MHRRILVILLGFALLGAFVAPRPAYAIDRRLKLAFKTAGYGAGAGAAVGAATWLIGGFGDWKNAFMGASLGMYAGVLFAGYLIFTPPEPKRFEMRPINVPRQPVDEDSWQYEPDDTLDEEILPNSETRHRIEEHEAFRKELYANQNLDTKKARAVWLPVFSMRF